MVYVGIRPSFYRYMETTRHLVFYRLDSTYPVPAGLVFPRVLSLTMIHCAPEAVARFLHPTHFPGVKRIHYLSAGPSDANLHTRFTPRVDWVFPLITRPYPFYDRMVEAGWGRREQGLVGQYLVSHKRVGKVKESWFDLYLPSIGIVSGEWYYAQQMAYLHKKHCDGFQVTYPVCSESATDPCVIRPPMNTSAILDSRWIYDQQCMTRQFEETVLPSA